CATSVQFSDAATNMPPRVPLKPDVAPVKNPRPRKPPRLSPAWTALRAPDVPRALLTTNRELPAFVNVVAVTCAAGPLVRALLTSSGAAGPNVPTPTLPFG